MGKGRVREYDDNKRSLLSEMKIIHLCIAFFDPQGSQPLCLRKTNKLYNRVYMLGLT